MIPPDLAPILYDDDSDLLHSIHYVFGKIDKMVLVHQEKKSLQHACNNDQI